MKLKLAMLCGLALASVNAMACYTVYDRSDRVIYRGADAPVDMSLPIHQTLGRNYPGAHMVFDLATSCSPVALAQVARSATNDVPVGTIRMERTKAAPTSSGPLLTDRATAQRNKLPHTTMAGNIVVVPAQAVAKVDLPTFTVIPADTAVASAAGSVDTRSMGAGPARRPAAGPTTTITEMRDGSSYVQRGYEPRGQVPPVQY